MTVADASGSSPCRVTVLHRGALGDSVLLWPRPRAWASRGARVELVTDGAKAALAARELGIVGTDAEQRRWNDLWRERAVVAPQPEVDLLVDHLSSAASVTFRANLRVAFPSARIVHEPAPRGGREAAAWLAANAAGAAPARSNPRGEFVLHVGAGGGGKRWPLNRWIELRELLGRQGPVRLIAGEVEREQFSAAERGMLETHGGAYLGDLSSLADAARSARLFVGCDSGPAHLAAQLGVATLAFFGPTDPALWAPVGPCVRVLAPPAPCGMEWLSVADVVAVVEDAAPR